jgi:hypothetical protein
MSIKKTEGLKRLLKTGYKLTHLDGQWQLLNGKPDYGYNISSVALDEYKKSGLYIALITLSTDRRPMVLFYEYDLTPKQHEVQP